MKRFHSFTRIAMICIRCFEGSLLVVAIYLFTATLYFKHALNLQRTDEAFLYSMLWWTDRTIWAPGFSEENFKNIKVGMKESEVLTLLGQPLEVINDCAKDKKNDFITLHYTSQSPYCCSIYGDHNHQRRYVQLSSSGLVLKKGSEFYID